MREEEGAFRFGTGELEARDDEKVEDPSRALVSIFNLDGGALRDELVEREEEEEFAGFR